MQRNPGSACHPDAEDEQPVNSNRTRAVLTGKVLVDDPEV